VKVGHRQACYTASPQPQQRLGGFAFTAPAASATATATATATAPLYHPVPPYHPYDLFPLAPLPSPALPHA
jgi:hypothetical protein